MKHRTGDPFLLLKSRKIERSPREEPTNGLQVRVRQKEKRKRKLRNKEQNG